MILKSLGRRTAPQVSQKNEDQADYTNQGHPRPEIHRKVHEQVVATRFEAGQRPDGYQEFAQVAGLAPIAIQDGALEDVPVGPVG